MSNSSGLLKIVKGWVYKEGKRLKTRSWRYLVLDGSKLSHYVKENGEPTWEINIKDVRISVGERPQEFCVSASSHKVSFFTESSDDYRMWIQALKSESSVLEDFYKVGTRIGSGSYGAVYVGEDKITKESRAIKVIIKNLNNHRQEQFIQREKAIFETVTHKNIVQMLDVFEGPKKLAIVSEYMKGGELFDMIVALQSFTEDNARLIMKQILEGVQYLHSRNIVHRDIKPENILCFDDQWPLVVKLTDFGLSNFLRMEDSTKDMLLSHVGTCYYIAPEMLGDQGYGPAVDIWACGVVLFIMLCGRFPFRARTNIEYMRSLNAGPHMTGAEWVNVTNLGKRYLSDLFQIDPTRRPTATEALNHPWIRTDIPPNIDRRLSSIEGITEITARQGQTPPHNEHPHLSHKTRNAK